MTTVKPRGGRKAVLETLLSGGESKGTRSSITLVASILVDNINTVPTAVAARHGLRLSIETYVQTRKVTKLTHRVLEVDTRPSHCALDPSVGSTIWTQAGRLE